ncbi:hypothetical protein HYPSUDRAFT_138388 [Hypholoma sublateritium FD-334 SS-4]|uniref:Uncharacterized protein n=1 Tax=Hypholoma sublateritium (strain FD-334 SS-4) TaxID=945553 RepID=A0A0D2MH39_HYPSF|nr:hypothetical protein HYPSUDRAFT_138388 [Hypholoma sublateritium FD-334 SS-4]
MPQPLARFANPHLLPQAFERATRAEIYAEDARSDGPSGVRGDSAEIEALNRLIEASLPAVAADVQHTARVSPGPSTESAPMDLGPEHPEEQPEELFLFRLISSAPPIALSLLPPPPPPSKTREPDAEDTEERALQRKQFAQAASIDGAQVLSESATLRAALHTRNKPITTLTASLGDGEPSMLIMRTLQPPRKTRPPVPSSHALHYPYVPDASTLPAQPSTSKIPGCLTVDAHPAQSPKDPKRRSRRRRGVEGMVQKLRPPPQFWRPSPDMKGKCRGYAYGYPSSLPTEYLGVWRYRRDTMKKAAFSDSSVGSHFRYT